MDGERESSEQRQRSVESAVLAIVIEKHPEPLPRLVLLGEMEAPPDDPARIAEVEAAIDDLVAVGLLITAEAGLSPSRASLHYSELEVGL
jgi:hypothetical protein